MTVCGCVVQRMEGMPQAVTRDELLRETDARERSLRDALERQVRPPPAASRTRGLLPQQLANPASQPVGPS